jgi:hypothetical protein
MATNFFPDGFPTTALEAVQFCTFLTENEKDEWYSWLKTADQEHKDDLVDTLHAIYSEQLGTSSATASNTQGLQNTDIPAFLPQQQDNNFNFSNNLNESGIKPEQTKEENKPNIKVTPTIIQSPKPESKVQIEVPKTIEEHVKKAESMLLSAQEVGDLYSKFLKAQDLSYTTNHDFNDKQGKLFNKIMEMVQEAAVLSDKVLKMNYENVQNAKSIQELKNATQVKGGTSLQYQINSLREDFKKLERNLEYSVERIDREFDEFRQDLTQRVDEMNSQIVAALADNYKADGIQEKVAKMQAKLEIRFEDLENKITKVSNNSNSVNKADSNLDKLKKNISHKDEDKPSKTDKENATNKSRSDSNNDYDSYFTTKSKPSDNPLPTVDDMVKLTNKQQSSIKDIKD